MTGDAHAIIESLIHANRLVISILAVIVLEYNSKAMATIFCLFFNNTQTEVLLAPSGRRWMLPCLDLQEDLFPYDTANLAALVRKELHIACEPLYAMSIGEAKQRGLVLAAIVPASVDNGVWCSFETAIRLIDDGQQRELVTEGAFKTITATTIIPWLDSTFRMNAMAWMTNQLAACNVCITSEIEHVKSSFVGWVAFADTSAGRVFFKAAPGVYCREVAITTMLSPLQPDYIPRPLAVDIERQWMLTHEVCGPTLTEVDCLETWEEALRCYAHLQRASIPFLAAHTDFPLYDYRPETLLVGIDWMMAEIQSLQHGYREALDDDEIRALCGSAHLLKDLCRRVADGGVPSALEHGDLHPGNIRITEQNPVFLDWAWSSVTHPFLSLSLLLHERLMPVQLREKRYRLLQTYLNEWTDLAPMASLESLAHLVDRWRIVAYAVGDAQWVAALRQQLGEESILENSYPTWTLRQRQYYLVKTLRRILSLQEKIDT